MIDKTPKLNLTRRLLTLCIVVVLGASCVSSTPAYDFDPREFQILSINTYYDEAHNMALEWDAAAYPSYIFATFAMPDDNDGALFINYGFRSHTVPMKWLMIIFNKTDPNNPKITSGEYLAGVDRPLTQEIEIKNLSLDSLDILAIAYQNGGSDFLRENKTVNANSFVELQQENEGLGTGPLVWTVAFLAGRNNGMYVTIDPLTGDVLDIKHIGK